MERTLHYIWKHRLYNEDDFRTADGARIYVLDPGLVNSDAGPDFFNAKIRIRNTVWVGNIEIHERASDWNLHRHNCDKLYNNVILHVVRTADCKVYRTDGEEVLQVVMPSPDKVEANIEWLLTRDSPVACIEQIREIPSVQITDWLAALLTERLVRKTQDIEARRLNCRKDWNETFYITLMRAFGFGANSDVFESLAKSLPFKHVLQHRANILQTEALLLGQAGQLDNNDDDSICNDDYITALKREYDFLSKKYKLKPVEGFLFKSLRTRPVNFPHIRLAQIAAVWHNNDVLFSTVLETDNINELRKLFAVSPSDYWLTHYNFRQQSNARKKKTLGKNAVDVILINAVIPTLFAYGKTKKQPDLCDRAMRLLEQLPPEHNNIVALFIDAGIDCRNASDSQALIQLRREYCDKKKCLYCRIGYRVIEKNAH